MGEAPQKQKLKSCFLRKYIDLHLIKKRAKPFTEILV